jgi:hypothetical protein
VNVCTLAPGRSAPADLRKDAGGFDLPIALGLLLGNGQVALDRPGNYAIVGELALTGETRPEFRGHHTQLPWTGDCFVPASRPPPVPAGSEERPPEVRHPPMLDVHAAAGGAASEQALRLRA